MYAVLRHAVYDEQSYGWDLSRVDYASVRRRIRFDFKMPQIYGPCLE